MPGCVFNSTDQLIKTSIRIMKYLDRHQQEVFLVPQPQQGRVMEVPHPQLGRVMEVLQAEYSDIQALHSGRIFPP